MLFYFDFLWSHDASDGASLVSDEGGAEYAHRYFAIHFLLTIYAQFLYQFLLGVADEWERQIILFYEFLVALGILGAHTDDHVSQ